MGDQPRLPRHIVVVGLMGAGKTEVGRRLGTQLGRPWRDSDRDIEARTGLTVRELRERDGVDAMHALEAEHLLDVLADPEPSVISAAASAVEVPECREALRAPDVRTVWLRATPEVLARRFASRDQHRPEFGDSPLQFLTEQATGRDPLFASLDPVVIDVDTGIDDSLALLYAAGSPDTELVAVTCVSGNIDAQQVAINTRAVLELAGRADVEVALGREIPLIRALETTPETHGPQGLGHAELPAPSRPMSDRHGVDLILEEAHRRPGEITLITLGPLTNLALAVMRAPTLPRLLKGYVLMGGAYGVSGNTTPTTEWNIHCDPEAAAIVFRAWSAAMEADPTIPRPMALGLDVTEQARVLPDDIVRLARRAGSAPDDSIALARGEDPMLATRSVASNPVVRYVADALRFYMEFHAHYDGFYGAFIHDPLAVAAALDRSLVTTEPIFVDVETRGEVTTGMTVADRRRLTGKAPNLDVVVTADIPEFMNRLIERIGGLAAASTA